MQVSKRPGKFQKRPVLLRVFTAMEYDGHSVVILHGTTDFTWYKRRYIVQKNLRGEEEFTWFKRSQRTLHGTKVLNMYLVKAL